jgi:hypothetical protein
MTKPVCIPEDGVVQGLRGLLMLPPWMRKQGLDLATNEQFLHLEPDLISAGEFWPMLCAEQREKWGVIRV